MPLDITTQTVDPGADDLTCMPQDGYYLPKLRDQQNHTGEQMPRTAAEITGSTIAGGRLTVSLPKEAAADLEKLKQHFEAEFEALHGIAIPLKPEQVIHAALKRLSEVVAEAAGKPDATTPAE